MHVGLLGEDSEEDKDQAFDNMEMGDQFSPPDRLDNIDQGKEMHTLLHLVF